MNETSILLLVFVLVVLVSFLSACLYGAWKERNAQRLAHYLVVKMVNQGGAVEVETKLCRVLGKCEDGVLRVDPNHPQNNL